MYLRQFQNGGTYYIIVGTEEMRLRYIRNAQCLKTFCALNNILYHSDWRPPFSVGLQRLAQL